jgi:hypothetical protein
VRITVLVSITERLMGAEVETPLYPDNKSLTVIIAARLDRHSKTSRAIKSSI